MSAAARQHSPGPWLVALDVDGTVLHHDDRLDLAVIEAARAAEARGHAVTLATGRSWATAGPILHRVGIRPEYVVCANGAITMQRDDSHPTGYVPIHVETFDPTQVLEQIRHYLPAGKFMVELPDGFRLYTPGMIEWNLENAREVSFEGLLDQRATRVVAVSLDHGLEEFFEIVERMGLHHVSYAVGVSAWLDVAPSGVNKATALERVRGWLDIPLDRVLAMGDGLNDLEMFHWAGAAGRAIAMGQAQRQVQDAATEVAPSVDECGVAVVLSTLP
ncbi:MAG TPA: HAD hydrolase family protein [Candidatus Lumbricidophila sp.]|nr:HAD hydrolase family protein [Candidatus Lumbricidophila sp.]